MSRVYTLGAAPTEKTPKENNAGAARTRYRSGFSPKQQAIYRRLVDDAWRAVCDNARDLVAKDRWYRETLKEKLGVYTSKQLNKSGDFERACATFEEIAGKDIYWQMRANAGPLERMRRKLRDFVQKHDVSEDYLAGISRQMFDTHPSNLDAPKLNKLIAAVEIHFARHAEESAVSAAN